MSREYITSLPYFPKEREAKLSKLQDEIKSFIMNSKPSVQLYLIYEIIETMLLREEQAFIRISNGNFSCGDYKYVVTSLGLLVDSLSKMINQIDSTNDAVEETKINEQKISIRQPLDRMLKMDDEID